MGEEKERSKFGEEMEPTSLWPGLVGRGRSFALGEDVGPRLKGRGRREQAPGAGAAGGCQPAGRMQTVREDASLPGGRFLGDSPPS